MRARAAANHDPTHVARPSEFIRSHLWAVSDGMLEHDPSQGIKRRFDEEARGRVFTGAELRTFWNGIARQPCFSSFAASVPPLQTKPMGRLRSIGPVIVEVFNPETNV